MTACSFERLGNKHLVFLKPKLLNNLLQPMPNNALRHRAIASLQIVSFSLAYLLEVVFSILADKVQALCLRVATLNFPLWLVIAQLLRTLHSCCVCPIFSVWFWV